MQLGSLSLCGFISRVFPAIQHSLGHFLKSVGPWWLPAILLLNLFAQLIKQQQTLTPEQEGARYGRIHCSVVSVSLCANKDLQLPSHDSVMDSTDCELFLQQCLTYNFLPKDLTIFSNDQIRAQWSWLVPLHSGFSQSAHRYLGMKAWK